ncbi:MAG TPA: AIPR family protein [Actinomycetota bacterium]|nr:AIPR family protein [Actinomycetota bacterium]
MLSQLLRVHEARRIGDPNYPGAVEHIFTVDVLDLPPLPLGANPRQQNTNKRVYREVAASLRNEDGTTTNTFLSKNLGIWTSADSVEKRSESEYLLTFGEGDSILDGLDGVINGGHTAQIIWDNQDAIRQKLAAGATIKQFVKLHVRVGYPRDVLADSAGALNTTLQVPEWSLAEHADKFDWIHNEIEGKPYANAISFKENQPGEIYVLDVLAMLDLFNTQEYPNTGSKHPTQAYAFKSGVLDRYLKDPGPFKRLAPILNDVLVLHDTIAMQGRDKYNEYFRINRTAQTRGAGKKLEWVETRSRGKFRFPVLDKEGDVRLNRAAVYPAMAAFRWMVEDRGTTVQWKGGFDNVLDLWGRVGPELMKITQDTSIENARKTLAIGKSPTHYNALHSVVAKYQLMLTPAKQPKLSASR